MPNMPDLTFAEGAKVIVELSQSGEPLKVYVAEETDGAPWLDLTRKGKQNPSHPVGDETRIETVEFHKGNCVKVGKYWYCT